MAEREYLTRPEAAMLLRCCEETLDKRIRKEEIAAYRVGRMARGCWNPRYAARTLACLGAQLPSTSSGARWVRCSDCVVGSDCR